jgi:hypothetical protein
MLLKLKLLLLLHLHLLLLHLCQYPPHLLSLLVHNFALLLQFTPNAGELLTRLVVGRERAFTGRWFIARRCG